MSTNGCFIINNVPRPDVKDIVKALLVFSQQGVKRTITKIQGNFPPPTSKLIKDTDMEKGLFVVLMSYQFSIMLFGVSYLTTMPHDRLTELTEELFNTVFSFQNLEGKSVYIESDLDYFRFYFSKYIEAIHTVKNNPLSADLKLGEEVLSDVIDIYAIEKSDLGDETIKLVSDLLDTEIATMDIIFKSGNVEWNEIN